MRAARLLRAAAIVCIVAAVSYWLFADTVRKNAHLLPAALRGRLAPAADEPLRISFWGPFEEFEMWKEMVGNFRRDHPDIPVRMEYFPHAYERKIPQLFVAGDAPDVICFQDEPFPKLVEAKQFEDLTTFAAERGEDLGLERFWPTAVASFRYDANGDLTGERHMYGLPIWGGCNMIFYNKDCFRRGGLRVGRLAGPAGLVRGDDGVWTVDDDRWTLDEFVAVGKRLTIRRGTHVEQYGFQLNYGGYFGYWLPFHMTLGVRILDEGLKRTTFYGPEAERSLTLWQDMVYKHRVSPEVGGLGQMGTNLAVFTGRVAMFSSGPWDMPFLNGSGMDYDVLHIPRRSPGGPRATRITWDAVCMYSRSKKKEQAWRLMQHLVGLESQVVIGKVQRSIPALKQAGEHFVRVNPKVAVGRFLTVAADYGRMQPITKYWNEMNRPLSDAMNALRDLDAAKRPNARQAIGLFLSNRKLMEVLPPADEQEAQRYRRIYREWLDRQGT